MFSVLRAATGPLAEAVRGFVVISTLDEPWPPCGAPLNRFPAMVYCGVTMITDGQVAVLDDSGNDAGRIAPRWTVFGPRTRPVASVTLAPLRCVTAILYPDAFRLLTGCEPARLKDRNDAGETWLPHEWQEWPQALQVRAGQPEAQIAWMAQWLLRRWLPIRQRWDRSIGTLVRASAVRKPSDAARAIGVSHRQLQRQALTTIGLSPVKVHRLQRAQQALRKLADPRLAGGAPVLARLAADLGFADQSHLTRDICDLTGLPPARLAAAVAHDPDYWVYRLDSGPVAFLQDAG
jgi:AraC-like DNA-binding protein